MYFFTILASLLFLVSADNKLVVVEDSSAPSSTAYFTSIKFGYHGYGSGNKFVACVSQLKPTSDAPNFRAVSTFLVDDKPVGTPSLELKKNNTHFTFETSLTLDNLEDSSLCKKIDSSSAASYFCTLRLTYFSYKEGSPLDSNKEYLKLTYGLVVNKQKTIGADYTLGAGPIYENGCDCSITTDIKLSGTILKEDCVTPLTTGVSLTYGDKICLKVTSNDPLAENYIFETASLAISFIDSNAKQQTVDIKSMSELTCGNPCQTRLALARVDLIAVGKIRFSQVIEFKESSNPSAPSIGNSDSTGKGSKVDVVLDTEDGTVDVINGVEDSFGITKFGLYYTLLSLLIALIIL